MEAFLSAQEDYNYSDACLELENLCKFESELGDDFFFQFMLNCFRFRKDDQPSGEDALDWFLYFNSLSNMLDQENHDELEIDFSHDMHIDKVISSSINFD
jgi:hypothetical protein